MFIYTALTGDTMAEDEKTLKEIAEERGIELNEVELDIQPTELPDDIIWWNEETLDSPDGYSVLTCWQQIVVEKDDAEEVQKFMRNMGCKQDIHIVGCYRTLPDLDERHKPESERLTGGRIDFLFYFADADIPKVAVRRLMHGIRWWDDVMDNEARHANDEGYESHAEYSIYPAELLKATGFDNHTWVED